MRPQDGSRGAVLDGRDIGTVIYPEAPVKLFITADPAIRAHRRHLELLNAGRETTLDQVRVKFVCLSVCLHACVFEWV